MGSLLLRRIRIIFNSLLLSQAVFLAASFLLLYGGLTDKVPEAAIPLLWIMAPLASAIMLVFALIFYRFQLRRARRIRIVANRLRLYSYAITIRMAMLNGVNLFNIAVFLLSGDPLFLFVTGGVVLASLLLVLGVFPGLLHDPIAYYYGLDGYLTMFLR